MALGKAVLLDLLDSPKRGDRILGDGFQEEGNYWDDLIGMWNIT